MSFGQVSSGSFLPANPRIQGENALVLVVLDPLSTVSYHATKWYSFRRPLDQAEWNTVRSYTRRVRSILDFGSAFHPDCVRTFLSPSSPEPLFPNLCYLRCVFANEVTPLLHQPLPSLISLDYLFVFEGNLSLLRESLESFPGASTKMKQLCIRVHQPEAIFDKLVSDYICRWSDPQNVYCPQIALDVKALTHLSRIPGLTQLTFALSANTITPCDTLFFSTLQELRLFSESLTPIPKLIVHTRLHAVMNFSVEIGSYPSRQSITSFFTALRPSVNCDTITRLRLTQIHHSFSVPRLVPLVLFADDLMPSTALRNLRHLDLNLGWSVGLTDRQLLDLASAWPHLEHLLINEEWGWQTAGGITPDGLVRLLQTCRSLTRVALAVDTRGYTAVHVPPLRFSVSLAVEPSISSSPSPSFSINVVDSVIETAAVPAMAAFFANVVPYSRFSLTAWGSWAFTWRMNKRMYVDRWSNVYVRAKEAIAQRSDISVPR